MNDIILYTTEDGCTRMKLRVEGQTVWLTQAEIAELFQTTPQNITIHIRSIYDEGEVLEGATCKDHLQVRAEGGRQVERTLKLYSLDLILAIGFRVRSNRGTQFRQWAMTHLREFVVKGFVMDDERLKSTGRWDYFDELRARIRRSWRGAVGGISCRAWGRFSSWWALVWARGVCAWALPRLGSF